MSNAIPRIVLNQQLISMERLDGEVIIISFETGKYYSAANSGADILWLIKDNVNPTSWEEILKKRFNMTSFPQNEIVKFLEKCLKEGIAEISNLDLNGVVNLPNDYDHEFWTQPTLLVFADLQDLLMVDPIHDSSLEGWPQLKHYDK